MIDYNVYGCADCGDEASVSPIKPGRCRICQSTNLQPLYQWFDPMDWSNKEVEKSK